MMKFSTSKSLISALIGAGLLSITAIAYAAPMTINNQSSVDLSFKVEHSCSGEFGNISPKTAITISHAELQNACSPNTDVSEHCHVKIYNKPNCAGTHVGSLELSTKDGIFFVEGGHADPQGKFLNFYANQFDLTVADASVK